MNTFIIWIDPNIFGEENNSYFNELSKKAFVIRKNTVEEAMEEIYKIYFQDVFIIVSGSLFPQFYKEFKTNLYRISIVPKIVIFTSNVKGLKNSLGTDQNIIGDKFYNIGGIKTDLEQIKQFIKDNSNKKNKHPIKIDEENYLNFDYLDSKEKLVLPLFYKHLIPFITQDNQFYNFLHTRYYNKSKEITHFLDSISDLNDIPIEILSRYYVRIYTEESDFYKELNQNLREKKRDIYLSYIKVLYEGIKLKALPFSNESILFRGTQLPNKEIAKMVELKNKGEVVGLPGAIVFSKTFLSFSKSINVAEQFMLYNPKEGFSKVLFILKKDNDINIDYNSSTQVDVGKLSLADDEEEVLFFPFSAFKIEKILKENNIYKIELNYLAKYYDSFDKNFTTFLRNIPNSEYKQELLDSDLITRNGDTSIQTNTLMEDYKSYRTDIKDPIKPIRTTRTNYLIRRIQLEDKDKFYHFFPQQSVLSLAPISPDNNYIIGTFIITERDLNQSIRIINSFEESQRKNNYIRVQNELKYNNEQEIINKCEIEIIGYRLNSIYNFTYFVNFPKTGEYTIKYKFKSPLKRADYMFAKCKNLKKIDLSNFYSKEVDNMSCMFMNCISLQDLNIDNLETRNVKDMRGMFYGCESLSKIDLSLFDAQNVENMSLLFFGCKSLVDVNLSRFNTQNVKDMYCMFGGCENLVYLNLLNFYTQNVINMTRMFSECRSLKELDLSNFYTNKVQYMNSMFYGCSSLSKLDISNFSLENIINFDDMFKECLSLRLENIKCIIINILIKRYPLYN